MDKNYKVLISNQELEQRTKELAKEISKDYEGKEPVIICMLKGAVYFFADLCKNITVPITIDFARLSSYRNGTTSGEMELIANITAEIKDKDVEIYLMHIDDREYITTINNEKFNVV